MTTPISLTLEDIDKLYVRTWEQMDRHFCRAFGAKLSDPFTEVESRYKEAFGVEVNGHLLAFQGVFDLETEEHRDAEGNVITDFAGTPIQAAIDAMELLLNRVPASIYNEDILRSIATCWMSLNAARTAIHDAETFEALHFLMHANYELGESGTLLAWRDDSRKKASQGGHKRHERMQEEKQRAIELYREHISPSLSAQQAALKLRDMGVNYNIGGLARLISAERKERM